MESKPIIQRLLWFERLAEQHIVTQHIDDPACAPQNIIWDVLRTDLIHPVCSGNKFFKLKYYLLDALQKNDTRILTYGGPWSNHIVATAYAANYCGLASTGFIRGENPAEWSDTLLQAREEGMQLEFLGRTEFPAFTQEQTGPAGSYTIPQGGYGPLGVKGAAEILNYCQKEHYTHFCCATGTGTMLAGLIRASGPDRECLGIAAVKDDSLKHHIEMLNQGYAGSRFTLNNNYHFGGFARKNNELISFMNKFYDAHGIPTDFVYTGKLMYAVRDFIRSGYFPAGSRILAIHSGGLQGNKSLKKGTLLF